MGWVSRKEYCEHEGIKLGAFKKRKGKGLIQWRYGASGRGGEAGKHIEVYIDDTNPTQSEKGEIPDRVRNDKKKNRYRVTRGEPGCHVITPIVNGEPDWIPASAGMTDQKIEAPPPSILPAPLGDTPPSGAVVLSPSPPPSPTGGEGVIVNPRSLRTANLRFALIQAFNEEAAKNHRPRKEIVDSFLGRYHSGLLLPDIHQELKKIKRSTLYNWLQLYEQGGLDALVPQYRGPENSNLLVGEKDFLLKFLLNQNKPKISDGIRECKRYLGEYSTSSASVLRRFVNQFKTCNHDIWTLKRDGEKAWNDQDAPYQDRDPMLLNVGDVIVADGHKLNLHVIDPISGKKRRATLVLFWDWASTMPLGWEVAFSENTQCITSALRNALLTLGKIPSNIYIDNGRAFLAKIFTRKIRVEETEIPGMIARLGSQYRRAMPYHGQSKPIERFFLIINDRLERRLPSYTGASIKDKPPYLLRNENLARKLHDDWAPTVDQLFEIMLQWREEYADEPRPRRNNLTARQIFDEGKGAGLDPKALCFLMMAVEVKSVRRSRFTFAGIDWEGPCIYGYHGKILIRYSLSDFSKIYVSDANDVYRGTVTQCGKADPIKDWQAAKQIVSERRKFKKHTKELAAFLIEGRKNPDLLDYIEAEEVSKPQTRMLSPFIDSNAAEPVEGAGTGASNQEVPAQPETTRRWKYDYEKYDDLMERKILTEADRKWIDEYRASSSLHKHTVFDDAQELDRKVTGFADEEPSGQSIVQQNPGD